QEQALVGFSLSGDREVVATLAEWAGKWSVLESAAKKDRRKQVIYALSRHPSIDAVKALKKLCKSWNADTKHMAKKALENRMQEIPMGASAHNPHHSDTADE
ncbi:MAG TPA: hypothetical protein VLB27_11690, partial [candidate division Zixibacteria bacterium]|nr:hypothetical protein [candidate division Zixibacteria bacterium]